MGLKNTAVIQRSFIQNLFIALIALACVSSVLSGCAGLRPAPEETKPEASGNADGKQSEQIQKLQEKVQDLEIRLAALNDKINLENGVKASAPPVTSEVIKTPAAHAHNVPKPAAESADTFVQDDAVDRYREAKILLESKKNSDAILEFSAFVKNYPNHTLAASAQYNLAMAYLQQGEYKLAEEELNRGLLNYPHSNVVPDTLLALADVSGKLGKDARVTYYKEKLLSAFPNSPQAKGVDLNAKPAEPKTEVKASIEQPEAPVPPTVPDSKDTEIKKIEDFKNE